MIYCLTLFMTLANGMDAFQPLEYHFTERDCLRASVRMEEQIEVIKRDNGYQYAYTACIPYPPASNLPQA